MCVLTPTLVKEWPSVLQDQLLAGTCRTSAEDILKPTMGSCVSVLCCSARELLGPGCHAFWGTMEGPSSHSQTHTRPTTGFWPQARDETTQLPPVQECPIFYITYV